MKKHFLSLFDPVHRWWTLSFFLLSALLIIASQVAGITDNLPRILMLLGGMISLFLAFLHPWRKSKYYAILAGVTIGLMFLTFLSIYILSSLHLNQYISEGLVMGFIGLICVPGFLVSIVGILFWSAKGR